MGKSLGRRKANPGTSGGRRDDGCAREEKESRSGGGWRQEA